MNFLSTTLASVILLFSLSTSAQTIDYEKQAFRPQYHFSPEKNWQGAPGGLVYFDEEYHLFYQYNPKSIEAGNSSWGHAVSSDMIHWKYLPTAISPDENSECAILSGCVIVDKNNDLGKQSGDTKTLLAFYTASGCGQQIAYSTDKGSTWQKYANNPIIPYDESDEASSPKVFWHEASQKWVMLLSRKQSEKETSKGVSIYNSDNLIDWEYKSHIPAMDDHPDLIEFTVENRPDEKAWVLLEGNGSYLLGDFDGSTFTSITGRMKSDWGTNYYAPQICSNIPDSDGRTIQIAWLKDGKFTDMPFNGQMTFPSELTVKKFPSGYKLLRKPLTEIEELHDKQYSWSHKNTIPGIDQNHLKKVSGACLHIIGEFDLKTSDNFGLMLRHSNKAAGIEVLYNVKRGVLTVLGNTVPLLPEDNIIKLEIILDRSSLEIYANDGQAVVSNLYETDLKSTDVVLFTNGGELEIVQADIYEMNSIWTEK